MTAENKEMLVGVRKIQRQSYSLYVAVPTNWQRHHNIRKGSEVKLYIDDAFNLVVKPAVEVLTDA